MFLSAERGPGTGVESAPDAPGAESGGRDLSESIASGIADGVRRSLDPRVIPLDRVVGRIVTVCASLALAAGGTITWFAADLGTVWLASIIAIWAGVTAALGWWLYKWPAVSYRHASYTVNVEGIEIRRGVVWRTVISVPRSRVQHTDVSQGPIERRYGLGTLDIYTAGTDHAKIELQGLAHEVAVEIRDHLLPLEAADAV